MRAGFLFNRLKIRDDFVTRTNVPNDDEPKSTDVNETTEDVVVVNGKKEDSFESDVKEQNQVLDEIIVEIKDVKKESTPEPKMIPEPVLMNGMDEEHTVSEELIDLDALKTRSIIDEPINSIDSVFDLILKPIPVENVRQEQKILFNDSDENTNDQYEFIVKIPNGQNSDEKIEVKFSTFDKNIGEKLACFLTKLDLNNLSNKEPSLSSDDFEVRMGNDEQTTSPPLVNIDCGGDSLRSPTTSDIIPINNIANTNTTRITYDRETILGLRKNHTLMDLKDSRVVRDILKQRLNLFRF